MSYQHIHHSPQGFGGPFPSAVPPPGFPYDAPPPPPPPPSRPGPGYQDYFTEGYNQPPQPTYEHTHHYRYGDDFRGRCWSFCRGCCAALCCCCMLEECCL
ncbi:hypothetical protein AAG906_004009 [Vitis piasezkii]|uniref:Cysteine-rich transmembrane CYSTM domain-containing protein n=1 Tax=Vitis vinifera TaxID=29760 RepID=F6I1P5_VITVI|nr:protein CYSTEINE-RICH TRANSMEMBRANE MODULE 7 [Vitis vinifera]XP_034697813.1 cysteine-rich and transmembrane domain-containing protein WIH2-like [Vitis riparia]|eukprot:XP_002262975.3 PREDICTED: cysteine-rich and transmembrane domain-containing protein A [Vitis vinifera]